MEAALATLGLCEDEPGFIGTGCGLRNDGDIVFTTDWCLEKIKACGGVDALLEAMLHHPDNAGVRTPKPLWILIPRLIALCVADLPRGTTSARSTCKRRGLLANVAR